MRNVLIELRLLSRHSVGVARLAAAGRSHTRRSQLTTRAGLIAPPVLSSRQPWSYGLRRAAKMARVGCRSTRRSTPRAVRPLDDRSSENNNSCWTNFSASCLCWPELRCCFTCCCSSGAHIEAATGRSGRAQSCLLRSQDIEAEGSAMSQWCDIDMSGTAGRTRVIDSYSQRSPSPGLLTTPNSC
jgi:hypothetical protein